METRKRRRRKGQRTEERAQEVINSVSSFVKSQANVHGWIHAIKQLSKAFVNVDLDRTQTLGLYEFELLLEEFIEFGASKDSKLVEYISDVCTKSAASLDSSVTGIQFQHITPLLTLTESEAADRTQLLYKKLNRLIARKHHGDVNNFFHEFATEKPSTGKETKDRPRRNAPGSKAEKQSASLSFDTFLGIVRLLQLGCDSISNPEAHQLFFCPFRSKADPYSATLHSFVQGFKALKRADDLQKVRKEETEQQIRMEQKLHGTQEKVVVDLAITVNDADAQRLASLKYHNVGSWPCKLRSSQSVFGGSSASRMCKIWCKYARETDFSSIKKFREQRVTHFFVTTERRNVSSDIFQLEPGFELAEDDARVPRQLTISGESPGGVQAVERKDMKDAEASTRDDETVKELENRSSNSKEVRLGNLFRKRRTSKTAKVGKTFYFCFKKEPTATTVITDLAITSGNYDLYWSPLWSAPGRNYDCVAHANCGAVNRKGNRDKKLTNMHTFLWLKTELVVKIDGSERLANPRGANAKKSSRETRPVSKADGTASAVNLAFKDLGTNLRTQLRTLTPLQLSECNIPYIIAEFQQQNNNTLTKQNIKRLFEKLHLSLNEQEWGMILDPKAPALTAASIIDLLVFSPSTVAEYINNSFIPKVLKYKSISDVEDAFLSIDPKATGFIPQDQFLDVLKTTFKLLTTSSRMSQLLSFFETDEDGRINYERFVNLVEQFQQRSAVSKPQDNLRSENDPARDVNSAAVDEETNTTSEHIAPALKTREERIEFAVQSILKDLQRVIFQCKVPNPTEHVFNYYFNQSTNASWMARTQISDSLFKHFPDAVAMLCAQDELASVCRACFNAEPHTTITIEQFKQFIQDTSAVSEHVQCKETDKKEVSRVLLAGISKLFIPNARLCGDISQLRYGRGGGSLYDHLLAQVNKKGSNFRVECNASSPLLVPFTDFREMLSRTTVRFTFNCLQEMYDEADLSDENTSDTWVDVRKFCNSLTIACGLNTGSDSVDGILRRTVTTSCSRGVSLEHLFQDILLPADADELWLDFKQFSNALKRLGVKWPSYEAQQELFEKVDVNNDGRVCLDDWKNYFRSWWVTGSKSLSAFHRSASLFRTFLRRLRAATNGWDNGYPLNSFEDNNATSKLLWGTFLPYDPVATGRIRHSDFVECLKHLLTENLDEKNLLVLAEHFKTKETCHWTGVDRVLIQYDSFCWYFEKPQLSDEYMQEIRCAFRRRAAISDTSLLRECEVQESKEGRGRESSGYLTPFGFRTAVREGLGEPILVDRMVNKLIGAFGVPVAELADRECWRNLEEVVDFRSLCEVLAPTSLEVQAALDDARLALEQRVSVESHFPSASGLVKQFDSTGKGFLDRAEFRHFAEEYLRIGAASDHTLVLLEHVDPQGTSRIQPSHLRELCKRVLAGSSRTQRLVMGRVRERIAASFHGDPGALLAALESYDHRRQGTVEELSFKVVLQRLGAGLSHEDFQEILKLYADHDGGPGRIRYKEFLLNILRIGAPGGTLDDRWVDQGEGGRAGFESSGSQGGAGQAESHKSVAAWRRAAEAESDTVQLGAEWARREDKLKYERTGLWTCTVCFHSHTQVRFLERCEMCSSVNLLSMSEEREQQLPYPYNIF